MPHNAEIQLTPQGLIQAVDTIFDDVEFALLQGDEALAYEVAARDTQPFDLPEGVKYKGYEDHLAPKPAEAADLDAARRAKAIIDKIGSISLGQDPKIVEIYAADGKHVVEVATDPASFISFLVEKGFRQPVPKQPATEKLPSPTRKYQTGLPATRVFPSSTLKTEHDTNYLASISGELPIPAVLTPETTAKPQADEQSAVEHPGSKASLVEHQLPVTEQLLTVSRILADVTLIKQADGRIVERPLRDGLLANYCLTAEDIEHAYEKVFAVEHRLGLLADDPAIRNRTARELTFDKITSTVVNTALKEFVDTAPAGSRPDGLTLKNGLPLNAAARAADAKLAKLLIEEDGLLTLCETDELAALRVGTPTVYFLPTAPPVPEGEMPAEKPGRLIEAVKNTAKTIGQRTRALIGAVARRHIQRA